MTRFTVMPSRSVAEQKPKPKPPAEECGTLFRRTDSKPGGTKTQSSGLVFDNLLLHCRSRGAAQTDGRGIYPMKTSLTVTLRRHDTLHRHAVSKCGGTKTQQNITRNAQKKGGYAPFFLFFEQLNQFSSVTLPVCLYFLPVLSQTISIHAYTSCLASLSAPTRPFHPCVASRVSKTLRPQRSYMLKK
jgi:hypothetical protein